MKKSTKISVLISLVLISILAIGAVSAADDTAVTDDADLAAVDDVQTVDDAPITDEIDYESNDILVTDTGDSSDLDDADTDVISDTGLKGDSDDGDKAVVSDASSPKNALKAVTDPDEPLRAPDGTFRDLYNLINGAQAGSTITLDRNYVYSASTDNNQIRGIVINKNIVIDGAGYTIDGRNTARLFNITTGSTITLKNLNLINGKAQTIQSGSTWNPTYNTLGGAILTTSAVTLTIDNCNFTNNKANYTQGNRRGGAIYSTSTSSSTTITNSNFNGNYAYEGGAIYGNSVTIRNSTFESNTAYNGGVIFASTGTSNLYNSSFNNNKATNGGVLYSTNTGVGINVIESNFTKNSASTSGGVFYTSGTTTIKSSVLVNNSAGTYGGVVYNGATGARLTMNYNVIMDNTATRGHTASYQSPNNIESIDYNWWGQNVLTDRGNIQSETESTYMSPQNHYILKLRQLSATVIEVSLNSLDTGTLPADAKLPAREYFMTISPDDAFIRTPTGNFTGAAVSNFTVPGNGTITAKVDYETIVLDIYQNTRDTIELNITIADVVLPNKAVAFVEASFDDIYNITVGEKTYQVTVSDGHGQVELDELPEGTYLAMLSHTGNDAFHDAYNLTTFHVTKAQSAISLEANTTTPTYGTDVKITPTVTSADGTVTITNGTIIYTVDGKNYAALEAGQDLIVTGLSAGEHRIVAKYGGNEQYEGSTSLELLINVQKATLTLSIVGAEVVYPEPGKITLNSNVDGVYTIYVGETPYEVRVSLGSGTVAIPTLDVGNYTVTVNVAESENYTAASATGTYNVTKAVPKFTIDGDDRITYGETNVIVPTLTEGATGTITYYVDNSATPVEYPNAFITPVLDAGTHTIRAEYAGDSNFAAKNATFTFTVVPAEVDVTVTGATVVYPVHANVTVTASAAGTYTITVNGKEYDVVIDEDGGSKLVNLDEIPVGVHYVAVNASATTNYKAVSIDKAATVVVNKPTLNLTVSNVTISYGETANVVITLKDGDTGLSMQNLIVSIGDTYYPVNVVDGEGTLSVTGLNAGTYNAIAVCSYSDNYDIAIANGTITVNKANPTLTVTTEAITYGQYATINVALNGVNDEKITGVVKVTIDGKDYDVPVTNGAGTLTVSGLAANEEGYAITVAFAGNDNYNSITNTDAKQVVNKAKPTLVVGHVEITYGEDAEVTITLEGVNGEKLNGIVMAYVNGTDLRDVIVENGVGYLTATGLAVGEYNIQTRYNGNENYNATGVIGESAIIVKNAAITVTGQDVSVTYPGKGSITITTDVAGAYTIKVGDKTYDNVELVAGENTFEVPDALEVGVYPVKVSAEIENYAPLVDEEIATYTVNQADVIISISPNATEITYGDSVSMSAVVSPDAITGEDITYYVDGTAVTSATLADLPAGTHTVVAKFAGDKNYKAAESNAVTITVNKAKADVTVTAESVTYPNVATVVVNSNVPGTYTIRVGNKDYAVVVGDTGSGSTVIDQLAPGTYEIDVSANLDNNYEPVSQIPATTLTVVAQTGPFVVASTGFGYATLAEALANTNGDDDTITVIESGTYTGTQNTGLTIDQTVTIKADEGLEVIFDAEGNNNFITIAAGNNVRLYNITVVNGKADYGGAVYVTSGAGLAVMDSAFSDNLAVKSGGAIYGEDGSSIVILRGEFTRNVANGEDAFPSGGAIYTVGGLSVITSSTFKDNQAGNSAGAIYMGADNFFIYKSVFTGNKANGGSAGALWVNGWTGNVEDCTFTENEARDFGGAIEWRVKEGTLTDSTFTSNKAGQGGAIHWYGKDGKITGTNTFTSNEATQNGGAIFWEGASGTVEGATFTSNKAGEESHGNAIYWLGNAGTVEGSTFDSNTGGAGAIIWLGAEGNIKDSYFANNGVNPAIFNIYKLADDLNIEANTFEISTATIKADKDAYTYMDTAVITGDFNWGVNDNPIGLKVDSTRGSEENDFIIENFVNGAFTYELKDLLTGEYTVGIVDFIESSKNNLFIIDATAADDFVVEKAEATINVDADKYVITYGETVELSSVVSPAGATGAVTYYVDDEPVDSAILTGLTGGEHTVYAKYAGDDNYETAVSEPITITVNKAVPTVTVSSNKDEVEYGETAELSNVIPADATGAVTYYVDGEAIEGSTLSDLAFGPHTVVAKFAGDNNYEAAESEPITVYGLPKKGTYTDLQYQIDKAISQAQEEGRPWGKVSLEYDFEFDEEYDLANNPAFINGVVINDSLLIEGNGFEISGEEQARIFNLPTEADVQMSRLYLSDGNAGDGYGGAIYSKSEDLQLYDITFSYNHAQKGGAIYVDGDNGFVMGSFLKFKNNEAEEDGGAVYVASAFRAQGEFSSNSAEYGGAIFVAEGGEISIDFAEFNMNEASSGSSIYISEGSKVHDLSICNFEENTDYQGATVVIEADDVEIRRSNFTHNGGRSGSVYWTGDNGKLTDCNFTENQVRGTGSVVSALGDNFIIDSCNFDSNVARNDGIIYLEGNDAELNKVTIQNNNAGKGAIVLNDATISIADSLFKDNNGEALNYNINNGGTIASITGTTFETIKPTITMDDSFAFGEVIPVNGTFDWGVKSPEMTMSFTVNGVPMEATVIDGKFAMNIDTQPDVGAYTVVISTFTDAKGNTYVVDTVTKTFEVTKQTPIVEVNDTTAEWNTPVDIPVKVTDENGNPLTGSVIVTVDWRVDGVTQVVELDENGEGKATFRINQALGEMTITANYTGNDNYKSAKETATLTITGSSELSLEVTANEVTYGDETIITVTAEDGSGEKIGLTQANVTVDDGEVQLLPVGADGTINLGKLAAGEHKIVVSFVNEFYEEMASAETVANVNPALVDVVVTATNYTVTESGELTITVTSEVEGTIAGTATVEIDGAIYKEDVAIENGVGNVKLENIAVGEHNVKVTFHSDNFKEVDNITTFTVSKATPTIDVEGDEYLMPGDSAFVTVTVKDGNKGLNGTAIVTVNGVDYVVTITDGEGQVQIFDLVANEYSIGAKFLETENYTEAVYDGDAVIDFMFHFAKFDIAIENITYGEDLVVVVENVTDSMGNPLSGTVFGEIKNDEGTGAGLVVYVEDGSGTATIKGLNASEYIAVASFSGADDDDVMYYGDTKTLNVLVSPAAALIEATVANYAFDETGKLIINVTDLGGKVLNGTVAVEIDDEILSTDIEVLDGEATVDLTGYAIGEHSVHVVFDNPNYRNVDAVTHFNVTKKTPVVEVNDTTAEWNTAVDIPVKVTDENGDPVTGTVLVTVDWDVDAVTQIVELDENGEGTATFRINQALGEMTITANYTGNDKYESAIDTAKLTITQSTDLDLEVTANEVTYGGDTILTVTATDGMGAVVELAKVNVTIDDVTKEYPVEDGKVNLGVLPAGDTEITVSVDDGVHKYAEDEVIATVSPAVPELTVTPGEAQVTIDVKDGDEPISGIATVYVDGDIENPITVEIDETGHAVVPIDAAPGTHAVEVVFNNENYTQARQTVAVNVPKLTPVVSVTGTEVEYGTPATVKVKVTDEDGNAVTGTVIVVASWEVDGETQVVELDENGEGEATFTLAGLDQGETADVNATFVATDKYASAFNDTEKIKITPSSELKLEVTADDVTVGEDTVLTITATDGAGAAVPIDKVNVTINGETKEYPVEDGKVNIGQLPVGTTEITVSYDDEFYEPAQDTVEATVNKLAADVEVSAGNGTVDITAKDNKTGEPISGTATIVVDGGEPIEVPIGEDGTIEYPIEAAPGPHTVEVTFTNDDYEPVTKTVTVVVPKYEATLSIANTTAPVYGQDVTIAPTLAPADATGTITYYVDGATTGTQLPIGENFVVSGLTAGEHTIKAKYSGDENYSEAESNVLTLNVEKAQLVFTIEDVIAYYPNAGTVNVVANNDGEYTINVNNKPYTVTVENGKGTVTDVELGLEVGEYDITWSIPDSDNYIGTEGSAKYTVVPAAPEFSITGSPEINYGQTNTIVPTLTEGATGTITYTIDGTEFSVTKPVGEEVVIEGLDAGDYTVTATYSGDDNYGTVKAYFNFKVLPIDVVVSVASDEVYYPNTGSINLTASAPGTYTVLVGNKTYTAVVTEAGVPVVVEVEQLEVGKYEINVTAPASTNYNAVDTGAIGTYVVSKAQSAIEVTYDPATGKATVTLEGKEDHVKLSESISFELDGQPRLGAKTTDGVYETEDLALAPGKHSIFVVFVGNENYLGSYDQVAFEVDKFSTAEVTVSADPIKEGEDAIIKITVKDGDKGLSGVVTVTLDGTDYAVDVTDGEGTLTVKNLVATETPTTEYPITAKFNGNDEYAEATGEGSIFVTDYNDVIIVISGGDETAQATLIDSDLNPINGKVNVTVDDNDPVELDVVDGKVIIPVDDEGDHDITVDYLGDDTHKPATESATVFVGKKLIPTNMVLTVSDITYTENEEVVVVLTAEDGTQMSGTVKLTIGDVVKEITVTNGQGKTTISGLNAGTKTAIAEFVSDGTYAGTVVTSTFNVRQMKTRIIARNMTTTAINVTEDGRIGQYFTWTLVDEKGRPLEGKAMSIGFNANVYNRVTNASGQARLQINLQNSGPYTFAITFLGDDNYEGSFEVVKIDVNKQKATLTASGATYKASASTKTLSATYKTKAGNPIVGKTVKFTVNGKTYSAKTDSKGVAKVNVSLTKAGSYTVKITAPATNTYAEINKTVTLKLT